MRNGLLDVEAFLAGRSECLLSLSPLWFSPICFPYDFDPGADCPRWKKFLARNLGDDPEKVTLLQQFAGYLLLTDLSYQCWLEMTGDGNNGKSVACAALCAVLGVSNVSAVPLELFGDKFRLVGTLGKLANIVAEIGELDKVAEGQVKSFVSGDLMTFERKNKQPFESYPTARLVMATNNPPHFSDKSDGTYRRRLILPFSVQITEQEKIRNMDKSWWWEQAGELPGLFLWALAGLASLRQQSGFTIPQASIAAAEALRINSNPARRFIQENYIATGEVKDRVASKPMYREYKDWCCDTGHKPLADCKFGVEVYRLSKGKVKPGKIEVKQSRENAYVGLRRLTTDEEGAPF